MKEVEQDDPMELVGVALPVANADAMAEAVIEEYLLLGWDPAQIMLLFKHPNYHMTHQIYHDRGEDYVRARMRAVYDRWSKGRLEGGRSDA